MTQLLERLRALVGDAGAVTDAEEAASYATDWRKRYSGAPLAVVKPASTAEVAAVMNQCAETRTAVVPQGGNTGLCGGATPLAAKDASRLVALGGQIIVKLGRMNRIRAVDALNNTLTAEAGCVLANLQQAAADADRLFPCRLPPKAAAKSAVIFPPTQAAPQYCATAMRAIWCSASKWCSPMDRSGMVCAGCAKTIPATT